MKILSQTCDFNGKYVYVGINMIPQKLRLTSEQKAIQAYARSSLNNLHSDDAEREKLKIPFIIGLTPFPTHSSSIANVDTTFRNYPICAKCKCTATNHIIECPDGSGFLCQICRGKNQPCAVSKNNLFSMFEAPFDPNETLRPKYVLMILEQSSITETNSIFSSVLSAIKKALNAESSIQYFSILIWGDKLDFPIVSGSRFTMGSICDLDDAFLPPRIFFDMSTQKDLLFQYIDYLAQLPHPSMNIKLIDIMKALRHLQFVHVITVTSETQLGNPEEFSKFAQESLGKPIAYDFIAIVPTNFVNNNAHSAFIDFGLLVSSNFHFYTTEQVNDALEDILETIISPRYYNITINVITDPIFKVDDICGRGIRRSDNSFELSSMCPNETVYFSMKQLRKIDQPSPHFQFQVKYTADYTRVRCFTANYTVCSHFNATSVNSDYSVVYAWHLAQAIEQCRADHQYKNVYKFFNAKLKSITDDNFAKLFLLANQDCDAKKFPYVSKYAKKTITTKNILSFYESTPPDVSHFLCPDVAAIEENQIGPFVPYPMSQQVGRALFVKCGKNVAVLLLRQGEITDQWLDELNNGPLGELVKSNCEQGKIMVLVNNYENKTPVLSHLRMFI